METETKTIDIQAKTWFDKVNGNSYFAANVTINFGMENETSFKLPLQYGYGDQYLYESKIELIKNGFIPDNSDCLTHFCRENNIILRYSNQKNCLKKELINM